MFKLIFIGLIAIIVLSALLLCWNYWRFTNSISADVARLETNAISPQAPIITEKMLASLPEPAQRYFRHAGAVGKRIPRIVRLRQKGRIRGDVDANWMQLEADEVYSINPPAFVWRAWVPIKNFPLALGRDEYAKGKGSIVMKMLATLPLAEDNSPSLGAAGLMRYLNEMAWFPMAYLGENITIAAVNADSFRVTLTDSGLSASAIIVIDQEGRLVNFMAQRLNTTTGSLESWETPMTSDAEFEGLSLPNSGSAVWKLETGDFTYIELEIVSVTYED